MENTLLATRWLEVRRRVDQICHAVDRDPAEVSILPVSKNFSPVVIREAAALNLTRFGENSVQEIRAKSISLADLNITWVMIGHLQTNKAKKVAQLISEVQSLDRLELVEALDQRLRAENRCMDVLIQVKTSPEPSKYGLLPDRLPGFLDSLCRYDTLRVRGLMTLATRSDDPVKVRACFRQLRELRDASVACGHTTVTQLSMGMSGDFPLAIQEGATEVRLGTSIFGQRN